MVSLVVVEIPEPSELSKRRWVGCCKGGLGGGCHLHDWLRYVGRYPDPRFGKEVNFQEQGNEGRRAKIRCRPGSGKPHAARAGLSKYSGQLRRARCFSAWGTENKHSLCVREFQLWALAKGVSLSLNMRIYSLLDVLLVTLSFSHSKC